MRDLFNQTEHANANFIVHAFESNPQSAPFLEANRKKFGKQLQTVYNLLQSGVVLNNRSALIEYGIGSLTSRISELRKAGMEITDEAQAELRFKVWFCTEAQILANKAKFGESHAKEDITCHSAKE